MKENLRKLQEDLLSEWAKLEGQVTKLDLWMTENGHVVSDASSVQTRQLFNRRKFATEDIQSKIFEVVDELQLHKEQIFVQIRKFSEIGIKFKEYKNHDQDNISEAGSSIAQVKIEVDAEGDSDISNLLQRPDHDQLHEYNEQESDSDFELNSSDDPDNQPQSTDSTKVVVSATGFKSFPCSHCTIIFATNETLSHHIRGVQGERPFVCRKGCLATFIGPSASCKHEKVSTGEATTRAGRKPAYLATSTTDNGDGTGTTRSKTVKQKSLVNHMKLIQKSKKEKILTSWSKPYPCSHCSKSFSTKNMLTYHMRAIQGERPFACGKGCSARFIAASHRNRHQKG